MQLQTNTLEAGSNINEDLFSIIGNTPLLQLQKMFPRQSVFAKMEYFNPTNSMKDRTAYEIITQAEEEGKLKPGMTIVESSSGNFGLAMAYIGKLKNYKVICVVDPRISPYFKRMFEILGVQMEMVHHEEDGSFQQARINRVRQLAEQIPNVFLPNQYDNPQNFMTHYKHTGAEIVEQMGDKPIDYVVMGISTGGTLSGIAEKIKEYHHKCKVIAVDTKGSILFDHTPKPRLMTGLGSNYISKNLNYQIIDDFILVEDKESLLTSRKALRKEGIFAGPSTGAILCAVEKLCKTIGPDANVVTVVPDSGNRYMDTFYNDEWVKKNLGYEMVL